MEELVAEQRRGRMAVRAHEPFCRCQPQEVTRHVLGLAFRPFHVWVVAGRATNRAAANLVCLLIEDRHFYRCIHTEVLAYFLGPGQDTRWMFGGTGRVPVT